MAGIAGIILRSEQSNGVEYYSLAFTRMLMYLKFHEEQHCKRYEASQTWFGNVIPVAQMQNDNFTQDDDENVFCLIDGMMFVDPDEKARLRSRFPTLDCSNDHRCLPFLFLLYGADLVHHITGWYNIFIYDKLNNRSLLFNDRLGYLPLYVYKDDKVIMFASKIEALLSTGLISQVQFDAVTMSEHLIFNYPLSDHTYIQQIRTLGDASLLQYSNDTYRESKYWDVSEWYGRDELNKKQSVDTVDQGLKDSIQRLFSRNSDPINFSLTGGWDSRVVLSYLLPGFRERIRAYSFGAPNAADIKIPELIATSESIDYRPFLLNQRYLDEEFIQDAVNTIMLSNGTRNYKRTHYVNAIRQMGQCSPWLLTGIFGDEVFKVGKPNGGGVISQNAVDLIDSDFNTGFIMQRILQSGITGLFKADKKKLLQELEERMMILSNKFTHYQTSGQKYFAFRFTLNLRKYFGNEVNSYNDFVWCHSPFIDTNFLQTLASTRYMPSRFEYIKPRLQWQVRSSRLYYEITRRNHPGLTSLPSSRGFSMRDINTINGLFRVFFNKTIKRKLQSNIDGFNTRVTDSLFDVKVRLDNCLLANPVNLQQAKFSDMSDAKSLHFWVNQILGKYFVS